MAVVPAARRPQTGSDGSLYQPGPAAAGGGVVTEMVWQVVDQVFPALGVGAFDEERPAPANAWQARLAGNAVFRSEVIC